MLFIYRKMKKHSMQIISIIINASVMLLPFKMNQDRERVTLLSAEKYFIENRLKL